jgi:hypothetical protein
MDAVLTRWTPCWSANEVSPHRHVLERQRHGAVSPPSQCGTTNTPPPPTHPPTPSLPLPSCWRRRGAASPHPPCPCPMPCPQKQKRRPWGGAPGGGERPGPGAGGGGAPRPPGARCSCRREEGAARCAGAAATGYRQFAALGPFSSGRCKNPVVVVVYYCM